MNAFYDKLQTLIDMHGFNDTRYNSMDDPEQLPCRNLIKCLGIKKGKNKNKWVSLQVGKGESIQQATPGSVVVNNESGWMYQSRPMSANT